LKYVYGITNTTFDKLNQDLIIDLKTNFGITQFMTLMTDYIIPNLKQNNPDNLFLQYLNQTEMYDNDNF
jgi:hypothetical protein